MPVKLSIATTNNLVSLDFNKELGIKPINIQDRFIGLDTKSRDFQNLFGNNAVLKGVFNEGYSKKYSANFDSGPVSVGASTKVTLGKIYAKLGTVTTVQFDLGGVNLGVKKSGSADLESVAPETGNGITLRAKTLESFGATPSLSLKLPTATLKLALLGNIDIAAAAVDTRLSGSLGFRALGKRRSVSGSTDLPKLSFPGRSTSVNISGKSQKPIELINFSLAEVINGKPKPGSKPGTKGKPKQFDFEIKGVRLTSDLKNPFAAAKITSTLSGTTPSIAISNRIPLITASMSLNKLAANGYPPLKLLAEKIKRESYNIDYKLLDFAVGSDLKIGYTGRLGFSEYYSRAQFENGQTLNLSNTANQYSSGLTVQNTTELKRLLDADGDGKATIRFNFGYNKVGLTLDFGLYANLFTQLEFGKLSVDVGTNIGFSNRFIDTSKRVGGEVVNFGPLYKGRLDILKDFKLPLPKGLATSKTIALNASPYQFSEVKTFNVPANADDLINILGLDPKAFYTVRGTAGNDNLVTRTEQGKDTLIGGTGADRMAGGRGNDNYSVDSASDVIIEDANAGYDVIWINSLTSYTLPDNVEGLVNLENANIVLLDNSPDDVKELVNQARNLNVTLIGNSLDNVIVSTFEDSNDTLMGGDGNDILTDLYGNDILDGGNGDDVLIGVFGSDTLIGGQGRDSFVLAVGGEYEHTIKDFEPSVDRLTIDLLSDVEKS